MPWSNLRIGMLLATVIQSGSGFIPKTIAASAAYFKLTFAAAFVKALLSTFSAHSSAATTFLISYLPGPFLSTLLVQKSAVAERIGYPFSRSHCLSWVTQ